MSLCFQANMFSLSVVNARSAAYFKFEVAVTFCEGSRLLLGELIGVLLVELIGVLLGELMVVG